MTARQINGSSQGSPTADRPASAQRGGLLENSPLDLATEHSAPG